MPAVLDTNVLVSGLARYEASATFGVVQAMGRKWDLAITPAIFLEYEDVLGREGIRRLTGLTTREVTHVLDYMAGPFELDPPRPRPLDARSRRGHPPKQRMN